jgi:HSP20 family protein
METTTIAKRKETLAPSLFNDFFKPWDEWFDNGVWLKSINTPSVNVKESNNHFTVTLAAPGLKKNDFKIEVDGNILTVSSETEKEVEEKDENYTRKEFSYSSFSRSLSLPDDVNKDKVEATYQDGILKIELPRLHEKKLDERKYIPVK